MKNLENGTEFIWPKEKFLNRLYLMKEMYNNYEEEEDDWDLPEVFKLIHNYEEIFFIIKKVRRMLSTIRSCVTSFFCLGLIETKQSKRLFLGLGLTSHGLIIQYTRVDLIIVGPIG